MNAALETKKILLGISGGIAAYKAAEIASRLRKAGAEVRVVMTENATRFITPLTMREISGNPVITDMWDEPKVWHTEHIALAQWADSVLIAPATANIIGKLANGIADDMLTTVVMATTVPITLAPAMNTAMYFNPITQENIAGLRKNGYNIIEPVAGQLACGTNGKGRLPEPIEIVSTLASLLTSATSMRGRKVLITAGGTREPIDPVRYIGNRSSGKMGYALARAASMRGAEVVLVSGPVALTPPQGVRTINVESAREMRDAVLAEFADSDIVIKAAAVSDYYVRNQAPQKIKKSEDTLTITLDKNPDILAELGQIKTTQTLIGFAAETEETVKHATDKLHRKNADMIIANDVTAPGAGFGSDTNIVKLLYRDGTVQELPQMDKQELAQLLLDKILIIKNKGATN